MSSDILRRIDRLERAMADLIPEVRSIREWREQQMTEHKENRRILWGILTGILVAVALMAIQGLVFLIQIKPVLTR